MHSLFCIAVLNTAFLIGYHSAFRFPVEQSCRSVVNDRALYQVLMEFVIPCWWDVVLSQHCLAWDRSDYMEDSFMGS